MTLTDKFHELYDSARENPEINKEIYRLVSEAPDSGERDGLLGFIYHDGIGVEADLDKCFEFAEKAALERDDPLGYYLLGYMCEHYETPDQNTGGPRQKYDHYDAEHFYEQCAEKESLWKNNALIWLGDYYMNSAKGGDPEIGIEYYEKIADNDEEAAERLSDYYWNLVMPDYQDDEDWTIPLFKWTKIAVELDPENEDFVYRLGWLYADGIGCEENPVEARHYFEEAYRLGDWRGAQSIAFMLEEYLDDNPYLPTDKRNEYRREIKLWKERERKLYEEELRRNPEELDDDNIEED